MLKSIPSDVFEKYIYKDNHFILVKDPKHSNIYFHYTIWCLTDIPNIKYITKKNIVILKEFIKKIEYKKILDIGKTQIYFTYPPTHNRLHLHIVPHHYISYRPLTQLYYLDDIDVIYNNIQKINIVNQQKKKSVSLQLKYKIGLIYLQNIKNITKLENIKINENIDCILVIRYQIKDEFLNNLVDNYKIINYHIYINNILKYKQMIQFDYYCVL